MKLTLEQILGFWLFALATVLATHPAMAADDNPVFIVKQTTRSVNDVVTAVKAFAKQKKWVYLGDFKVKKGQVVLVKFCVRAAGKKAWKAGLKVSAFLPCGNMGVYKKDGKTEISLLNPDYMTRLYPNPNLKEAVAILAPMYKEMMQAITK